MRDLVILLRTNFLIKRKLFKSKNENFLIGNKKMFRFAKINIKKSVMKIVKIISKILLEKNLNLNKNKCLLVIALFLLKRSKTVLTSLQQLFRPWPPTGWNVWNASPIKTYFLKLKTGKFKDNETGNILNSPIIWSNLNSSGRIVDKLSNKKFLSEFNLSIDFNVVEVQITWYMFFSKGNNASGPSFLKIS